jgi:serine/threonine-protein kinase
MAPEQLEGKAPTPSFDLFAFGIVLLELLTGKPATLPGSPVALVAARLAGEAPNPRRAKRQVDGRFSAIVERCLQRDPEKRFPSASAIARALERVDLAAPHAGRRAGYVWWTAIALAPALALALAAGLHGRRFARPEAKVPLAPSPLTALSAEAIPESQPSAPSSERVADPGPSASAAAVLLSRDAPPHPRGSANRRPPAVAPSPSAGDLRSLLHNAEMEERQ